MPSETDAFLWWKVVSSAGQRRQRSGSFAADCRYVLIHDGVRPFVSERLLRETWNSALESGAAIAAIPATDTVKRVDSRRVSRLCLASISGWYKRRRFFRRRSSLMPTGKRLKKGWSGTDDAAFVERAGHPVSVVVGERTNVKVTTPEDLAWAGCILEDRGRRREVRGRKSGIGGPNSEVGNREYEVGRLRITDSEFSDMLLYTSCRASFMASGVVKPVG